MMMIQPDLTSYSTQPARLGRAINPRAATRIRLQMRALEEASRNAKMSGRCKLKLKPKPKPKTKGRLAVMVQIEIEIEVEYRVLARRIACPSCLAPPVRNSIAPPPLVGSFGAFQLDSHLPKA